MCFYRDEMNTFYLNFVPLLSAPIENSFHTFLKNRTKIGRHHNSQKDKARDILLCIFNILIPYSYSCLGFKLWKKLICTGLKENAASGELKL